MATVMSTGNSLFSVKLKDQREGENLFTFVFVAKSLDEVKSEVRRVLATKHNNNPDWEPGMEDWVDYDNIKVLDNSKLEDVVEVMLATVMGAVFPINGAR